MNEQEKATIPLTKILISPRVDALPNANLLTLATTIFILFCSSSAVFLLPLLVRNEKQLILLFPIQDPSEYLTCSPLELLGDERNAEQHTRFGNIIIPVSRIKLDVAVPEKFEALSISLNLDEIEEFVEEMLAVQSESLTFFNLLDISTLSFVEAVNENEAILNLRNSTCVLQIEERVGITSICNQTGVFIGDIRLESSFIYTGLISYFFNYHIPSSEWDALGGIFAPSRLDENGGLSRSLSVMDKSLVNVNVFCTDLTTSDFFVDFGLYSGFGFLFEGIITFLFAITIFSYRLEIEEKDYSERSGKGENSRDSSEKKVELENLRRLVHNPRCEFLQHAGTISCLSSILFFLLTGVFAYIIMEYNQQEVCNLVIFDKLSELSETHVCNSIGITEVIPYNVDTQSRGTGFDFGIYTTNSIFNIVDFTNFNSTHNPLFNAKIIQELLEICPDEFRDDDDVGNPSCLESSETFFLTNPEVFDILNEFDSYIEEYTFSEDKNITGEIFLSYTSGFITIQVSVSHPQFNFDARSLMASLIRFNPEEPVVPYPMNTMIRSFLKDAVFESNQISQRMSSLTSTCCRTEPIFGYFESFGIALAYMIFLEGFVVLAVAQCFYCIVDRGTS